MQTAMRVCQSIKAWPFLAYRLPSLRLPSCSRWQLSDSKGGLVRCGAWKPLGPTDLSCADLGSADRQRLTAGARTPGARSPAATFRAHGSAARWRDRMMNGTSVRPPHLPLPASCLPADPSASQLLPVKTRRTTLKSTIDRCTY